MHDFRNETGPAPPSRLARLGGAAAMMAVIVALAGCSATGSARTSSAPGSTAPTVRSTPPSAPTTTIPPTTVPPTTTTTTIEQPQPGWTPVSMVGGRIAIDEQSFTGPAGGQVTVFRFRAGRSTFRLHVGSSDPPVGGAAIGPGSGPVIAADETPLLLAAFNGGFNSSTGVGGFEVGSQVLVPLVSGMASLVIDADGTARVGVWGTDVPVPGEQVVSVRQNLPPLVSGGQPSSDIVDVPAWGATLGGGTTVARSALGQDAQGNLLYAGGIALQPSDLAAALVNSGAVTAMELDINPEWVQLDWAATPGGALTAGIPGQNRPADQYQEGWTRDFITVLATG